ncbi:Uncharacterized protein HZ326_3086 [Fusarium oxysporum f. sp. albedinis]|nr:Uncharacterized protein HZ326_3086 [Fusarium oxysporum f. sp. albedinis]
MDLLASVVRTDDILCKASSADMEDNICMRRIHDCDVAAAPILFFPLWPRAIPQSWRRRLDANTPLSQGKAKTRALRCAPLYSSSSAQQKMVLSYNPGLNYDRCQIGLVIADGCLDSDAEAIVAWNRMAWQTMFVLGQLIEHDALCIVLTQPPAMRCFSNVYPRPVDVLCLITKRIDSTHLTSSSSSIDTPSDTPVIAILLPTPLPMLLDACS